jgi:hypothetical protein
VFGIGVGTYLVFDGAGITHLPFSFNNFNSDRVHNRWQAYHNSRYHKKLKMNDKQKVNNT